MQKPRYWAILCACLLVISASVHAELYPKSGVLTVTVTGLESDKGSVHASLFDKKNRWMKLDRAVVTRVVPAKSGQLQIELKAPLKKRYALSVFHDENDNGKLDTGFPIPKPIEPVGASNHDGKSIPRYYECSFRFQEAPMEISVALSRP